MADEYRIEAGPAASRERGCDSVARVDQEAEAIGFDEIPAAGTARSGVTAAAPDHRQPHRAQSSACLDSSPRPRRRRAPTSQLATLPPRARAATSFFTPQAAMACLASGRSRIESRPRSLRHPRLVADPWPADRLPCRMRPHMARSSRLQSRPRPDGPGLTRTSGRGSRAQVSGERSATSAPGTSCEMPVGASTMRAAARVEM